MGRLEEDEVRLVGLLREAVACWGLKGVKEIVLELLQMQQAIPGSQSRQHFEPSLWPHFRCPLDLEPRHGPPWDCHRSGTDQPKH